MKLALFFLPFFLGNALFAQSQGKNYSTLYNEAVEYIGKQDYSTAITYLNQALIQKKEFAEAIFARGTCYLMLEQRENACIDFMEAERLKWKPATDYREKYCSRFTPGKAVKPVTPVKPSGGK